MRASRLHREAKVIERNRVFQQSVKSGRGCCCIGHKIETGMMPWTSNSRTDNNTLVQRSAEVRYTLTRTQPPGWAGFSGRVDQAMLARVAWPASQRPLAFICGPTPFVEAVAELLVARHYPSSRVKTERFGGA